MKTIIAKLKWQADAVLTLINEVNMVDEEKKLDEVSIKKIRLISATLSSTEHQLRQLAWYLEESTKLKGPLV